MDRVVDYVRALNTKTNQLEHDDGNDAKDDGILATLLEVYVDLNVCMAGTAHLSIHHCHLQHDGVRLQRRGVGA